MLKFDYRYEELYEMTLKELTNALKNKKQGLGYELWKNAYLITLGISDLLKDKKSRSSFPNSPEEASPELYPPKPSIKKPDFLKGKEGGKQYG